MRYVIKNLTTGRYLAGRSRWSRTWQSAIYSARLYHRAADAERVVEEELRPHSCHDFAVIPVELREIYN